MKASVPLISILVVLFFGQNSHGQIVGFYPPADTIIVGGGCTVPEIICHEFAGSMFQDSISIDPGWNTWMFNRDSLGNRIDFDNSYFLVNDSTDQFEYEIWLHPHSYPSILVLFDSTFWCDFWKFDIQLVVKEQGVTIDSLSQPFKSEYGLGIEDEENALLISQQIKLFQNYPNPFNPVTNVRFFLPKAGPVTIEVFDVAGKKMATVLNSKKPAGSYSIEFDGSNLASGIYFYRLQAGQFVDVKKMILMK